MLQWGALSASWTALGLQDESSVVIRTCQMMLEGLEQRRAVCTEVVGLIVQAVQNPRHLFCYKSIALVGSSTNSDCVLGCVAGMPGTSVKCHAMLCSGVSIQAHHVWRQSRLLQPH
jgi:hypothetical protein